jgi:hypothetical protein
MTFQERCKTISGEVQNDLRGGAHLSPPPLKSGHAMSYMKIISVIPSLLAACNLEEENFGSIFISRSHEI